MLTQGKLLAGASALAAVVFSAGVSAADAKGSLYGDIRWSLDYSEDRSATPGPTFDATDNNSYWGVKASTSQGGITAFGAYERFIDNDGLFFSEVTRQAYAGLQGGFGTLKYGQHTTAYADAGRKLDPFYNTTVTGIGGIGLGTILGGGNSHGTSTAFNANIAGAAFVPNHLAYATPSFGGVTVNAALFLDETGNEDQDHSYGGGVEFNHAGITAGVQLLDINNATTWAIADDSEAARVYGGYTANRFGVGVSVEKLNFGGTPVDAEYYMASGWFGVTENTRLAASYGNENESGAEGDSLRLGVFHDVIDNFTIWAAALRFDGDNAQSGIVNDVVTLGASYKFDLGFSTAK